LIAVKQQMVVSMKVSPAKVQTARIAAIIDKLASFTEADRPYTRLIFSPEFDVARNWLADAFAAAGLVCHIDSGGNLIGTRTANLKPADGGKANRPPAGTVSICDPIRTFARSALLPSAGFKLAVRVPIKLPPESI